MKKLFLLFLIVSIGLTVFISSCDILGLTGGDDTGGEVDIQAVSVAPLVSGDEVVGVRVTLVNNGDTQKTVTYSIFLSEDTILSTVNDILVYETSVVIPASGQQVIDLSTETDIDPYMQDHSVSIGYGNYYIGVKVDRGNDITESNEQNNEAVSITTFPLEPNYLDGTVSLEVTNAPPALEGTYVYFGIMPSGAADGADALAGNRLTIGTGGTGSATAMDLSTINWTDFTGSNWMGEGGESYTVNWFIDINNDYNPETNAGPGTGDITGDSFLITQLNGNETVTLDIDTITLPAFDGILSFQILNAGDYEGKRYISRSFQLMKHPDMIWDIIPLQFPGVPVWKQLFWQPWMKQVLQ